MPKAAAAKPVALDALFDEMQTLLAPYARLFSVAEKSRVKVGDKRNYHLITKKEVTVDGRKYGERWFASLILQKGYVGFYFTPIAPSLKKALAPDLLKLLKGKSCFHVKVLTPELKTAIGTPSKSRQSAIRRMAGCRVIVGWPRAAVAPTCSRKSTRGPHPLVFEEWASPSRMSSRCN